MKGAIADPLASTNRTPTNPSVITMGASQYFLFSLMNCQSSLITRAFDMPLPVGLASEAQFCAFCAFVWPQFCAFCAFLWLKTSSRSVADPVV